VTTGDGQRTWKDYATEVKADLDRVVARNNELADALQEWQQALAERDERILSLKTNLDRAVARNNELADEIQRRKDNLQEWQRAVADRDTRIRQLKTDLTAANTCIAELQESLEIREGVVDMVVRLVIVLLQRHDQLQSREGSTKEYSIFSPKP